MICPDCLHKLSFVRSPVCKKCGKEIEDGSLEFCPDCMRHPRAFEYGIALLNYDEAARHSMAQIKYNNKREYLDFYGTALAARYGRTIRRMQAEKPDFERAETDPDWKILLVDDLQLMQEEEQQR